MSLRYVGRRREDHTVDFWVEQVFDGAITRYEITRYTRYPGYGFDWGASQNRERERVNLAYSILADWFLRHHNRHHASSKVVLETFNLPLKLAQERLMSQEHHNLLISHETLVRFDSRERNLEIKEPDWLRESLGRWPECPNCGSINSHTNLDEDHPLKRRCSDCKTIYIILRA
jgi:hypothetical protein